MGKFLGVCILKIADILIKKGGRGMRTKKFDLVGAIMSYEAGELRGQEVLRLFSELLKSGQVWGLQGSYGRQAKALIDRGYLSAKGEILKAVE
jgi:hypothetical protein